MLYNTGHKFIKIIDPPSQEDIYNCPYYLAMSYEQIKQSGAPQFLIKILNEFPFSGRKNFLQIRPQDFRTNELPYNFDGTHWHTDYNVRLLRYDKQVKFYAKNHQDFRIMSMSFGAGPSTQFITTPMELPNNLETQDSKEKWDIWDKSVKSRLEQGYDSKTSAKNQLSEYTTLDLHRCDGSIYSNGLRLVIVAIENDDIDGNVRILPTIRDYDNGISVPADYRR
jgi:hypothetical protein